MLGRFWEGFFTQWDNVGPARDTALMTNSAIQGLLVLAMLVCGYVIIFAAAMRIWSATDGFRSEAQPHEPAGALVS
jgi:hypothetical protein